MASQIEESALCGENGSPPMSRTKCVAVPAKTAHAAGRRTTNATTSNNRRNIPVWPKVRVPAISTLAPTR